MSNINWKPCSSKIRTKSIFACWAALFVKVTVGEVSAIHPVSLSLKLKSLACISA